MYILSESNRNHLTSYLHDLQQCRNEEARRQTFVAFVAHLFAGTHAAPHIALGAESTVRVDIHGVQATRRIDTFHGNAIIEFENNLAGTHAHALDQLREQTAGVWTKEGKPFRPLVAIATDGVEWELYRPKVTNSRKKNLGPGDIDLGEPLQKFKVSRDNLGFFYFWLQNQLFRPSVTVPSVELFTFDFGVQSPLHADGMERLYLAWHRVADHNEPRVAFDTWRRYLRYTYGSILNAASDDEATRRRLLDLFLRHTYLAGVARLLAWAALAHGRFEGDLAHHVRAVLGGDYFRSRNLANLVEEDFFHWVRMADATDAMMPFWERTVIQLGNYDLNRLSQDVLKGVYEQLVGPEERHELGEYYTPEWLCERIVADMLPTDRAVSVLDPACGSGSFLRAAIAHTLEHVSFDDDAQTLQNLLTNVVGIDVHPLAVMIARITYLLAVRKLIPKAGREVQIPVYLADALFLPHEVREPQLGQAFENYEINFGPSHKACRIQIPKALVQAPQWFDPAVAAAADVAADLAADSGDTRRSLENTLRPVVPQLFEHDDADYMLKSLWNFTSELAELIRRQEDSIWAFVVKNAYRPAMLRNHFEFILGNPPWLSYRYVDDPAYQDEIRRRAHHEYQVAPDTASLMTQMELASVFLAHAIDAFGTDDARLAFVMPRSLLTADQHTHIRTRAYTARFTLTAYWDLMDVRPLFKVPACVLFADRRRARWKVSYELPAKEWAGKLPERNATWEQARPLLSAREKTARLIHLGGRNALATGPGATRPERAGYYLDKFAQGATLVPRNLYFVTVPDLNGRRKEEGVYTVRTDEEQARLAKKPWKGVRIEGRVEGRFLFGTALGRHVLPFVLLEPDPVVLPIDCSRARVKMLSVRDLRQAGHRGMGKYMKRVGEIWDEHKTRRNAKMTPLQRLDYQRGLTKQPVGKKCWLVLYNAAGTNLSACYSYTGDHQLPFVVEHKLYWYVARSEDEAAYLAAILNSETVNRAVKPFQSVGLQGERDLEKKPLELPLRLYSEHDPVHVELAALGREATAAAADVPLADDFPTRLADRRAAVRDALADVRDRIDRAVVNLLEAPATSTPGKSKK